MQNLHEQREHKIVGYTVLNTGVGLATLKNNQDISFKYDKWTKGKSVAITLSNGVIDAPNIDIYIEHDELVNLLRFLLGEQKNLIDKIVVVTSSPNASHVEIQEQIVTAIKKALNDAELS